MWWLFAVLVLGCAPVDTAASAKRLADPSSEVHGYWVWKARVQDGTPVLQIDDVDLEPRAGSSGWSGCPDRYLCTRYGIRLLAFGQQGTAHVVGNPVTSSDLQHPGTYSVAGSTIEFSRTAYYSCAHPSVRAVGETQFVLPFELRNDELWVRVQTFETTRPGFFRTQPQPLPTEQGRWEVYRRVSEEAYYDRHLLRLCQPEPGAACVGGCFSRNLIEM